MPFTRACGGNNDERSVHQETLSSYSIGETEVTQELWLAVMGSNPSYFNGGMFGTNLQRPVEYVSWNDCQEFITRLNQLTGQHFRQPTEAEWEFAARGCNKSKGYKYAGSNNPDDIAWYEPNAFYVDDYGTVPWPPKNYPASLKISPTFSETFK